MWRPQRNSSFVPERHIACLILRYCLPIPQRRGFSGLNRYRSGLHTVRGKDFGRLLRTKGLVRNNDEYRSGQLCLETLNESKLRSRTFQGKPLRSCLGFENGQFASSATFGCFSKGVSMVSLFLLKPMHPASYLAYEVKFGQTLDLPLDGNSLTESIGKQGSSKPYKFSPASNTVQSFSPQEELPKNQIPRWDIEPDWTSAPQNIHF